MNTTNYPHARTYKGVFFRAKIILAHMISVFYFYLYLLGLQPAIGSKGTSLSLREALFPGAHARIYKVQLYFLLITQLVAMLVCFANRVLVCSVVIYPHVSLLRKPGALCVIKSTNTRTAGSFLK